MDGYSQTPQEEDANEKEEEDLRKAKKAWKKACSDITPRREGQIPTKRQQEPISEETRRKAQAYLQQKAQEKTYKWITQTQNGETTTNRRWRSKS